MKTRSILLILPLTTTIAVIGSSFLVSPARAFFLRSTGRSTNSNEEVLFSFSSNFSLNELINLKPGIHPGLVTDFIYKDLADVSDENDDVLIISENIIDLQVVTPVSNRLNEFIEPNFLMKS